MRPRKPETTGEGDLFRARLDQIINLKHELVQLGAKIEAEIDREIERDRKRPHKLMLKSKPRPPWRSPPE